MTHGSHKCGPHLLWVASSLNVGDNSPTRRVVTASLNNLVRDRSGLGRSTLNIVPTLHMLCLAFRRARSITTGSFVGSMGYSNLRSRHSETDEAVKEGYEYDPDLQNASHSHGRLGGNFLINTNSGTVGLDVSNTLQLSCLRWASEMFVERPAIPLH